MREEEDKNLARARKILEDEKMYSLEKKEEHRKQYLDIMAENERQKLLRDAAKAKEADHDLKLMKDYKEMLDRQVRTSHISRYYRCIVILYALCIYRRKLVVVGIVRRMRSRPSDKQQISKIDKGSSRKRKSYWLLSNTMQRRRMKRTRRRN